MYVSVAVKLLVTLVCILMVIRLIGQKELSQTTPLDLVFMILLADIVGGMIHGKEFNLLHIIFTVAMWGFFMWGAEKLTQKRTFERLIDGEPEIIITNGTVNTQLMKKENLTMQELNTQLRKQGVFNIKEVRLGILEIDGSISVDLSKREFEKQEA